MDSLKEPQSLAHSKDYTTRVDMKDFGYAEAISKLEMRMAVETSQMMD